MEIFVRLWESRHDTEIALVRIRETPAHFRLRKSRHWISWNPKIYLCIFKKLHLAISYGAENPEGNLIIFSCLFHKDFQTVCDRPGNYSKWSNLTLVTLFEVFVLGIAKHQKASLFLSQPIQVPCCMSNGKFDKLFVLCWKSF